MSTATSSFRWRRPSRKSSVPFFPGAWPSTTIENVTDGSVFPLDDIEALAQSHPASLERSDPHSASMGSSPQLPHIDHVMDFHRRISQSYTVSDSPRRQSSLTPFSPSLSHSPQMPPLAELTNSSIHPLPAEAGPNPSSFYQGSRLFSTTKSQDSKYLSCTGQTPNRPPRNPNRIPSDSYVPPTANAKVPDTCRLSSIQLDGPLLNFVPGLPPLSLPSHDLSFSPESVASYFGSPDSRVTEAGSSPALLSPPSSSSSPSSFALSRVSQQHMVPSSGCGIASSFYPVPEGQSSRLHGLPTPSTSGSSRAFGATDSPVLPSDEDPTSPGLSVASFFTGHRRTSQGHTPSSADMDAFGLAASHSVTSDSQSAVSIPTSFQSASALESTSIARSQSLSPDDTARGHACRQSSVSLSLSMSLTSDMDIEIGHNGFYAAQEDTSQEEDFELRDSRRRRSDAPSPSPSAVSRSDLPTNSISGQVVATHAESKKSPSGKLLSFEKVKKFGGRLKKIFKGKTESISMNTSSSEIGVTTTTSVTAIEYASEHPIPRSESEAFTSKTPVSSPKSPSSRTPKKNRRQTMPVSSSSLPIVSHPQQLRPVSFLAINSSRGGTSRHLLSMPNVVGLSPARSQRRSDTQVLKQMHAKEKEKPIDQVERHVIPGPSIAPVPPVTRSRTRTQTAPQTRGETQCAKSRRLSLSSAIGEALRTTVVPHPPLPENAITRSRQSSSHGFSRRRSVSTSAGDAWNSARVKAATSYEPSTSHHNTARHRSMVVGLDRVKSSGVQQREKRMSRRIPPPDKNMPASRPSEVDTIKAPTSSGITGIVPNIANDRTRSQTQSTIRDSACNPIQVQGESGPVQTVMEGVQPNTKRRARGFSFSSAISRRALRARSIIVGRPMEQPSIPAPIISQENVPTLSSGISFDIISAEQSSSNSSAHRETRTTTSGCADYDPDLVLDKMSFAETPELPSAAVSSTDLSLSPDPEFSTNAHLMLSRELALRGSASSSTAVSGEDEWDENDPDREEEREFMRTLGIEFDEIVRRARSQ